MKKRLFTLLAQRGSYKVRLRIAAVVFLFLWIVQAFIQKYTTTGPLEPITLFVSTVLAFILIPASETSDTTVKFIAICSLMNFCVAIWLLRLDGIETFLSSNLSILMLAHVGSALIGWYLWEFKKCLVNFKKFAQQGTGYSRLFFFLTIIIAGISVYILMRDRDFNENRVAISVSTKKQNGEDTILRDIKIPVNKVIPGKKVILSFSGGRSLATGRDSTVYRYIHDSSNAFLGKDEIVGSIVKPDWWNRVKR